MRSFSAEVPMNIIAKLNEKLSKYTSPKVNWLTKRPRLLNLMGGVFSCVPFLGFIALLSSLLDADWVFILSVIIAAFVTPLVAMTVFWLFEKQQTPKQEKVIEKYTNLILKNFSESEYYEVKIKLLKILNSEPYTPVHFLEEMFTLKTNLVKDKQREDEKYSVNDCSKLTVLIEQLEQDETAHQVAKNEIREQKLKSVFKL